MPKRNLVTAGSSLAYSRRLLISGTAVLSTGGCTCNRKAHKWNNDWARGRLHPLCMRKLVGDCTPWGVVSSMIPAKPEAKIMELLDKLHRLLKLANHI